LTSAQLPQYLNEDFILETPTACILYHQYAENEPIFDYHCHLPPQAIADDIRFKNITQAWLYGDHYKWRAMRSNGIAEEFCTGNADDYQKFTKWAETVPYAVGNPLCLWTHLELKRYFGISGKILCPETARSVYDACNEKLALPEFSVRGMMRKMNVRAVCTTDDPVDDLRAHKKIAESGFEIKVLPTFRPDKAMAPETGNAWLEWLDRLSGASGINISDYSDLLAALDSRHAFFHENGCRLSDHGIETAYSADFSQKEIEKIFQKGRRLKPLSGEEINKFRAAMMIDFARMDARRGWTQQIHIGALRNNNTLLFRRLGADTGFDSIHDLPVASALSRFLDSLNTLGCLPKTILYNLNPRDNELLASMIGNFQDGSVPGKMQYGSGWWFLDQRDGMERQLTALMNLGLLSRFVGMLTDSRSFLSYPRHESFRRILCNLLGKAAETGEIPSDIGILGKIVSAVCYSNAVQFFKIPGLTLQE